MAAFNSKQYELTVQNLINDIEENAVTETERILPLCIQLEDYAREHEMEELYAYAQYSRALCLYLNNQLEESLSYYVNCVLILEETEQWELVARTYNRMGILSENQDNIMNAMDYYLKAETVSEKHGLLLIQVFVHSNVATFYMKYEDLDKAKKHLHAALDIIDRLRNGNEADNSNLSDTHVSTVYLNLANCHYKDSDYVNALKALNKVKEIYYNTMDEQTRVCMKILGAQIYHLGGEIVKRDECITELIDSVLPSAILVDIVDDIVSYANFVLDIDKEEAFWNTVNALERLTRSSGSPYLNRRITELKISYYKKKENRAEYLMEAGLYYELSMQMEKERVHIYRDSLATRVRLEEEQKRRKAIEDEATNYKMRSEIDALTSLNNRYKITKISEKSFEDCLHNNVPLAVEILDIDHFKQYNDNYGHPEGDRILRKVSGVIHSLERHEGVYTGRYGGDEFLIIYVNRTSDEVVGFMQELKDKVEELKIPHDFSPVHNMVSLSQGAYYHIPTENMTPLDFLHQADHALYHVKKQQKNNYYIMKE